MPYGNKTILHEGGTERQGYPISVHHRRNLPLKTWENMIPDIHGEHFRLTDAQWKYLSDAFKIEGVPTYLIVDREGNTTFRQTGFPGVEKMKEELLKVTK